MLTLRVAIVLLLLGFSSLISGAASARVIKVLPHLLDLKGRHSVSPSLYDRDAYQAELRKNPEQRSGMRFDIQWKAQGYGNSNLKLKMEVRTSKTNAAKPLVLEQIVKPRGWFSKWTSLPIIGKDYQEMGDVIAWRATLWNGEEQVAELNSFLW